MQACDSTVTGQGAKSSPHSAAFVDVILKKNTAVKYLIYILGCMFMIHSLQLKLEKKSSCFLKLILMNLNILNFATITTIICFFPNFVPLDTL